MRAIMGNLGRFRNENSHDEWLFAARTDILAVELERKSGTLVHVGQTRSIIGVGCSRARTRFARKCFRRRSFSATLNRGIPYSFSLSLSLSLSLPASRRDVIRLYDELREPLAMINAWRAACRNFLTYDKAGGTNDGWWLLTEEREKERERERDPPLPCGAGVSANFDRFRN